MKKIKILILIGLISQLSLKAKEVEGQILIDHDTFHVVFDIPVNWLAKNPNFLKLQNKIKYFDTNGQLHVLYPDQAREIQFIFNGKNFRMLSVPNFRGSGRSLKRNKRLFLRLEVDGDLRLFKHYVHEEIPGMYDASTGGSIGNYHYVSERNILQKSNGILVGTKGLNFKRQMTNFFEDCPEMLNQIESREFRRKTMDLMVEYYNTSCRG